MDQQQALANQISVFYSYADTDERLQKQLEAHLGLLRQQGIIAQWHHRQIVPGTNWAQEMDLHLATARVILLLISALPQENLPFPSSSRHVLMTLLWAFLQDHNFAHLLGSRRRTCYSLERKRKIFREASQHLAVVSRRPPA